MDLPALSDLRSRSAILTTAFPDGSGDDGLTVLRDDASALVAALTGRIIGDFSGEECVEDVPTGLVPLAKRAIALKAEALYFRGGTEAARRKRLKNGNLQSISAGPWSETYFGPDAAAKAKMLDPDPELNEALWAIASECMRSYWMALWTGEQPGAAVAVAYDYAARPGGIPGSWLTSGW